MSLTPYPHQVKGCEFLIENDGGAIFSEPRTGKTLCVLNFLLEQGKFPALIICPKSVIASWYGALIENGTPREDIVLFDSHKGSVINLINKLILRDQKYFIINYEKVITTNAFSIRTILLKCLPRLDWRAIVLDESYKLASFDSNISNYMMKFKKPTYQSRVIMTGTPICETPLDVVQPYMFLNGSFFDETDPISYRLKYYFFNGYKWIIKSALHQKKVENFVKENSFQVKLKDLNLGGEILHGESIIPMNDLCKKWYDWIKTVTVYERYLDGELMEITPAIRTLFYQKASSGINPLTGEILDIDKAEWIRDLFLEDGSKTLVISRFTKPIESMNEVFKKVGIKSDIIKGSVSLEDRETIRKAFQENELDIVVAQEDTVARGLDFSSLERIIYVSNLFSYEARGQSVLRGQNVKRTKPYEVIDLCVDNSIDNLIVKKLRSKERLVNRFVKELNEEMKELW